MEKWIPIENIFISERVGVAKPNPKVFNHIGSKLKLSAEKTVYIGDSFDNDVIGAKQVGWHSIWMNHRKRKKPTSSFTPDKILYSPSELIDLVNYYL